MPACSCPHCHTPLWVKDTQLNVAQGFVVCRQCEGLFKANAHILANDGHFQEEALPAALTDIRLVHNIGTQMRQHKQLSRNEIADLLDGITLSPPIAPIQNKKNSINWGMASLIAFAILIMQLFYLFLLS